VVQVVLQELQEVVEQDLIRFKTLD
jgi:hypothetical protein